jgi:predicted cupin superfamily sugar epimerase
MSAAPLGGAGDTGAGEPSSIGASGPERLTAEDVIGTLDLVPHREGGYFRETYRSDVSVSTVHGKRSSSTACMYLLTGKEPSRFHRLRSDEVWFYHAGTLAELVLLQPVRAGARRLVGGGAGHSGRAGRLG